MLVKVQRPPTRSDGAASPLASQTVSLEELTVPKEVRPSETAAHSVLHFSHQEFRQMFVSMRLILKRRSEGRQVID